jgi:rRNA maturation protein Nop10
MTLEVACPNCGKVVFFGDYCQACGAQIAVVCPNRKCKTVQPPVGDKCIKCGKPLK